MDKYRIQYYKYRHRLSSSYSINCDAILSYLDTQKKSTVFKLNLLDEQSINGNLSTVNDEHINDQKNTLISFNDQIKQLMSDNQLLRSIIALIPGNVYWKDRDGRFLGCNNNVANILGYEKPDDLIGKRNDELFDPTLAAQADELDNKIQNTAMAAYREEQGLNIDKQAATYLTKKSPLFNDTGEVIGILGVSLDITERKKIEEDLKLAKERAEAISMAKSEFIANLSHDIKTPLAGMIGMAELLTYHLKEQKNLEFAQILLLSGKQLLNFFDNCMEAFKLESDITLITETFSLNTLLHEIVDLFKPSIKAKELDFEIRINPATPDHLNGCRAGFYRILLNMVGNAIKFTHKGKIFIHVNYNNINLSSINLYISIEDTGIGIANDKFDIIFDRFTRLIPSYKGTYEGSGIGLYIVKRYITAMNGHIQVASQENKGSRFDITLPFTIDLQPIKPTSDKNESRELPIKKSIKPIRVLLVEDNFAAQMMQKTLLTSMQCRVDLVDDGEKALELFEPGKFDLIFLDIGLPGIQGDTVAKLIRKLEQHSEHHTPIIALTAHTTSDVIQQYLTNGIDSVYSKPLTKENAEEILILHTSDHEHI